jgi:hypothetical protein
MSSADCRSVQSTPMICSGRISLRSLSITKGVPTKAAAVEQHPAQAGRDVVGGERHHLNASDAQSHGWNAGAAVVPEGVRG